MATKYNHAAIAFLWYQHIHIWKRTVSKTKGIADQETKKSWTHRWRHDDAVHLYPPNANQCLSSTLLSPQQALAKQHQPLKHDMRYVLAMDDWCVWCVWKAGRVVEQQKARRFKGRGGQRDSNKADCTWRIKTQRHAKRQKYCNEKQVLIEIVMRDWLY